MLLPALKVGSKTNIPGSKNRWPFNSPFVTYTSSCQSEDQTIFHRVKGIDNAFDHIELCLSYVQAEVKV